MPPTEHQRLLVGLMYVGIPVIILLIALWGNWIHAPWAPEKSPVYFSSRDHVRTSNYQEPSRMNFAEAVKSLEQNWIEYDVEIFDGTRTHNGALMAIATWHDMVRKHEFMDFDGMGHAIDDNGNIIYAPDHLDPKGLVQNPSWHKPSRAAEVPKEAAFMLWYNK